MEDLRHANIHEYETPPYKKRKRRMGDRKEGRRIRSLNFLKRTLKTQSIKKFKEMGKSIIYITELKQ